MNKQGDKEAENLLSDRVRLSIMVSLVSAKAPLDFNFLLNHLKLTKGNLSSHIRKLEEAGLVEIIKTFIDRKPNTSYRSTPEGKATFQNYLSGIEELIKISRNINR